MGGGDIRWFLRECFIEMKDRENGFKLTISRQESPVRLIFSLDVSSEDVRLYILCKVVATKKEEKSEDVIDMSQYFHWSFYDEDTETGSNFVVNRLGFVPLKKEALHVIVDYLCLAKKLVTSSR
jgi:hypothetical protein